MSKPIITLSAGIAPVEGGTIGSYLITLDSPAPVCGLKVNFTTLGSTATFNTDYRFAYGENLTAVTSPSFKIAAGATTASLNLIAYTDTAADHNESVVIHLTAGTGYQLQLSAFSAALLPNTAMLLIADPLNNHAPVLDAPATIHYIDTPRMDNFYSDTAIVSGSLVGHDVDPNTTLTYGIVDGADYGDGTIVMSSLYGALTVTVATGDYMFTPYGWAIEPLKADVIDTFSVSVFDGLLMTTQTLTLSITQSGNMESINNDILLGTVGNDVFDGLTGADKMTGGKGDDSYYVDNAGDVVKELAGQGMDIVYVSFYGNFNHYTLAANVENMTLYSGRTPELITGIGNALNNHLTSGSAFSNTFLEGRAGNDRLSGNPAGTSTLLGGIGNDSYYLYNNVDIVKEYAGKGVDTVYSVKSYTLTANVENLVLDNSEFLFIDGTGNALNNRLTGNDADNILTGGSGADTLIGGLGKDSYMLAEPKAATDTLKIATGDSLAESFHVASGFKLGTGLINTAGVDKLDLDHTCIAANITTVNGSDAGIIHSHHINNGIISFDDINHYAAPLNITTSALDNVFAYLPANITGGNTVAFVSEGNSFVFQDGGVSDTVVELIGVTAHSLSNTGFVADSVWIA